MSRPRRSARHPTRSPAWAHFLPGYGGFRMLTNAVLSHGFTQAGPLLTALAWLTGTAVAAALLFGRNMRTAGARAEPVAGAARSGS